MTCLTLPAYAKLNLTLDVVGRRPDGYHDLCMVMQSISLRDRLSVEWGPGSGVWVRTDLSYLPSDERNLGSAAARRFLSALGLEGEVRIHIHKRIPVCAGMAGGSSDAAAVLRALNRLAGTGLSPGELARIGEGVGSDVPYCVLGGAALAEGRGERLTPLPGLPPCWVVVCKPPFPISTPELFAALSGRRLRCRPDTAGMLDALDRGDLAGAARRMYNVFEDVLSPRHRRAVDELRQELTARGALGVCMSGTGPSVFGLFDSEASARSAARALEGEGREVFTARPVGPADGEDAVFSGDSAEGEV